MRPLIGVTKSYGFSGLIQNLAIRLCLYFSKARSINLTSKYPQFDVDIHGLVISGGTDLYPGIYKSKDIKENYKYDHERDELELAWLTQAKRKKLPIFCICRGAQLLNIFMGGTLHTDVSKIYEQANYPNSLWGKIFYRKKINIKPDTRLSDIFKQNESEVNSLHSQSIDKVGYGLEVSAVENNGVIQAVENEGACFIMGLQFHPEFLFYRKDIRNLFHKFVMESKNNVH
ncbi:peptidase C26 [Bacteriovorax sp. BAL6_X]|uniref:gamma-glutamyl-gamma-aminobutyrate hydrolase family protein n=1 Tax=Bacteriovorax sp. BAL6_X TaxID=1201290 RepID=UPI000385719D|nr:gamma-glutamyl-gamma-aminobutyrate hydrolase family protein [Bacteriovorax sp. BAL6_X]EPZ49760.1 peptidase C26 [Bacteriovorax sp. BAL6_X]